MPLFDYPTETVFTWAATPLKFGIGALSEIGEDCVSLGLRRVLVLTDARVLETGAVQRVSDSIHASGITSETYDRVAVEPTDQSIAEAVAFAKAGTWDGYVAVGGGSVMDTAKAVNLLTTQEGELLDYIAPPIGAGRRIERPVKPLVAVPTTAGTGSESTTICVVDLLERRLKAGISATQLRPVLAVVDPLTTLSAPPEVTAASGIDVLSHAVESYTALAFDARPRFQNAASRAAFCGANPISDAWCEVAMGKVGRYLRRAVYDGDDLEARREMAFASAVTGMGFGNAGTHIPHANAYPVAGAVTDYQPSGYPSMPMVPHGQAVGATAPAAFRFTFPSNRDRHLRAAHLISGQALASDAGERALPDVLTSLMKDIEMPNGIGAFGYRSTDIDMLVEGTMKQSRQLSVVPRKLTEKAARTIFEESMENW